MRFSICIRAIKASVLSALDRGSVAYFATPEDNRDEGKHNDYLQLPRNTESVQPSDPKTIILRDVERRTRTLTNDRSTPRKQSRSLTRKPCPPEHHMQSHPSSSPMVVIEGSIERPGSVMTEEIVSAFSPPLRRSKSLPRSAQPMRNRYPPVSNTELSQGMPYNQTPQSGPYQGEEIQLRFQSLCFLRIIKVGIKDFSLLCFFASIPILTLHSHSSLQSSYEHMI